MHQAIDGENQHTHESVIGSHSCQVYTSSSEHAELIIPFFVRGLAAHFKCVCTTDSYTQDELIHLFHEKNVDLTSYIASGQFTYFSSRETYAHTGIFDANRTLTIFKDFCTTAIQEGYKGMYVSGDAAWSLANEDSISRLLDYESKVNRLTSTMPIVGLCLYDAHKISYETMYNVMRVHPEIRVDDVRVKSPYYVPPDVYERIKDKSAPATECIQLLSDLKAMELKTRADTEANKSHVSELELLNSTMMDRELKMIELKNRIAELEKSQTSKT
jgi:hypothetical protein